MRTSIVPVLKTFEVESKIARKANIHNNIMLDDSYLILLLQPA